MGDVIGDLNRRRGLIEGMEDGPSGKIIRAWCRWPKCSVMRLLRSANPGSCLPTPWNSLKYHDAPTNVAQAVIEERKSLMRFPPTTVGGV